MSNCPLEGCPLDNTLTGCNNDGYREVCEHMAPLIAEYTYDYMVEKLTNSKECFVRFTKVDNTIRKMRCTLNPNFLPTPNSNIEKSNNLTIINVWDLDVGDWRRFRVNSVLEFSFV